MPTNVILATKTYTDSGDAATLAAATVAINNAASASGGGGDISRTDVSSRGDLWRHDTRGYHRKGQKPYAGLTVYAPSIQSPATVTSTTIAAIDATNMICNFEVPPSGQVMVTASGLWSVASGELKISLMQGGSAIAASEMVVATATFGRPYKWLAAALVVPSRYQTFTLGWRVTAGTGTLRYGGVDGPVTIEVMAA